LAEERAREEAAYLAAKNKPKEEKPDSTIIRMVKNVNQNVLDIEEKMA